MLRSIQSGSTAKPIDRSLGKSIESVSDLKQEGPEDLLAKYTRIFAAYNAGRSKLFSFSETNIKKDNILGEVNKLLVASRDENGQVSEDGIVNLVKNLCIQCMENINYEKTDSLKGLTGHIFNLIQDLFKHALEFHSSDIILSIYNTILLGFHKENYVTKVIISRNLELSDSISNEKSLNEAEIFTKIARDYIPNLDIQNKEKIQGLKKFFLPRQENKPKLISANNKLFRDDVGTGNTCAGHIGNDEL